MSFSRAKAALADNRFADLRWVPETGSTNADVLAVLAAESPGASGDHMDLVVVADHQSAGRGRLDRSWEAPAGSSLLMTAGTTRKIADERRGLVLSAMGLAAIAALDAELGYRAQLKWPNDLVAVGVGDDGADLKLGGILAEAAPLADGATATAVGIGLNCNWGSIPSSLAGIATSLDIVTGAEADREALAAAIIVGFASRLDLLDSAAGAAEVVAEARTRSATLGRDVEVHLPHGEIEGRAVDLDSDGALLVEAGESAEVHRVVVGDVVHVRPARPTRPN